TVAETYFYYYDYLMDEVMDLYVDDLHTVLKDDVNRRTIKALRDKVNTPNEFGEMNPNAEALLRELDTAEQILNAESLSSAVEIHNGITTNDAGRGFSGINAWQPLGVSIGTGEEVTIYVGSNQKKTGDSTNLRLIVTQYHSESSGVTLDGANLKVGANTFKLSKSSIVGAESGGALYIQYQGASDSSEKYSVRVTGGSEVPFLDLYQVTDEEERLERTVAYVKKLDEYVPTIEALHNEIHKGSENKNIDYDYDSQNCILGASDILGDTMMYSLPAQQILAGAGTGTAEERAETILKSMKSMEDMMYLFYQHKGLNKNAQDVVDQIPKGHLNIRYQRMFTGAFMYAAGNHIGIEWGSVSGMVNSTGVTFDENGKYISGNYFGWGIAHEIGHDINQGSYTVAEITNNYYSQLSTAKDTNESVRPSYNEIFKKVTSGTKGDSTNLATQLGIYWQLHLAYDKGLNYKTYDNYEEQLENLFYARMDTYARTPSKAPQAEENGVALTLDGGTDQVLMRLACAAAEKNILEYFTRWGKIPNADTIAYASQFEKETRAIMFANDDSRVYALNGKGSQLGTKSDVSAIENISVAIGSQPNEVNLNFTPDSTKISDADILGYEVIRCTISGGKIEEKPVGFAQSPEFTDTVTTLNNRTVFYKVTLIDQYLNRSEVYETDMIKIEHDGSVDKSNFAIITNGLEAEITVDDATEQTPCSGTAHDPAELA
ncbi:MAG: M60 family metallopeptidase, partial [Oscillospiraceae bacterium]|nr:M60 family metallopeptidase [Oscillospiraceae bacterium]